MGGKFRIFFIFTVGSYGGFEEVTIASVCGKLSMRKMKKQTGRSAGEGINE